MIAAFFHDERFARDAAGAYYGSGALPYRAFARYLTHFDRVVVVGRLGGATASARTLASGEGVEWACVDVSGVPFGRYLPVLVRRVREVLARTDCAVVRLPSLVGAVACREAIRAGKPWMAEVVGDAFEALWNHGSWKGKLAAAPMHVLTRRCISRARFAVYVTREVLQRRYPAGGEWVAASNVVIDAPRPEILERRLAWIEARAGTAVATLGLVGSYDVAYKGHATALRAVALMRRRGTPVRLRCIGVGDPRRWRARARELGLEQWVELGGSLPHGASVFRWMDDLDVCLVPSLTEGLPRILVEAMSRAVPAVGSRVGGIPELLEPRVLHRAGDHRGLARVLGALLADGEALKAQARRNWVTAAEYASDVLEARRDALVRRFRAAVAAARAPSGEAQPAGV